MKFILFGVVGFCSLNLTAEAKLRIHNIADDFEKFWATHKHENDIEKIAAIKREVFPQFKVFFDWKVEKWKKSGKNSDEEILRHLNIFKEIETEFATRNKAISNEIEKNLPAFLNAFPEFDQNFDIYITHSFGDMDGGTRKIKGQMYLIFGIDGMVKYHSEISNDNPFFHHELFHVYHNKILGRTEGLWASLWAEGLATYVSKILNPMSTVKDIMLDTPGGMYLKCEESEKEILEEIEKVLNSEKKKTMSGTFSYLQKIKKFR